MGPCTYQRPGLLVSACWVFGYLEATETGPSILNPWSPCIEPIDRQVIRSTSKSEAKKLTDVYVFQCIDTYILLYDDSLTLSLSLYICLFLYL